MASVSDPKQLEADPTTRWAPTASSSSSTPRPIPSALGALFEQHGLPAVARHRSQERDAVPAGRHQLHRQRRAGQLRAALRARARPVVCAMAFRVKDAAQGLSSARSSSAREPRRERRSGRWSSTSRRSRASAAALIYLVDRYGDAARSTTSTSCRSSGAASREPPGVGPHLHRPPDAQRASRPHGRVGRVLRAALQLPRDPLLRHRGQADRPASRAP